MKLSKYVKLVKGGGYCMVAHVEDSGIWLGTRSAIFRATELPDMVGEEQVRTVLDMPEKAWEKVHFDERWEGTVKSIFGMNLSDYADGEQDTEKLKVMAAPDGLWCDCRRSMDDGELIFYREAMLSPLAEQIKESDYIRYTVRKMESGQRYLVVHDGFEVLAAIMPVRIVTEKYLADLSEFQALCTEQFYRERARGEFAAQETVPFPVSWTVKMKKKQKETQDILSYHTQAAGCSDKARAKASGGRQPIEECGRTGL